MVVSRRPRLSRISTDRQRRQKSSLFSFVVPYNCLQLADAREEDGTIIFYPGAAEASPINRTMRSTPETSCFFNENTVSYFTQATFTARMNYLERSCRYDYQLANSVWCQWKKGARWKGNAFAAKMVQLTAQRVLANRATCIPVVFSICLIVISAIITCLVRTRCLNLIEAIW